MATITKPMALDETLHTTESTPRRQADVLAGIQQAIREGFGQVASGIEYDNTTSGLTSDNVQGAIDEVDAALDVVEDDIESTQEVTGNPLTLTDCAPINAESLVVEFSPKQDLHGQSAPYVGGAGKNKLPMTVDGIKAANTTGTWSGNVYTINGVTLTILTNTGGNVTGIVVNGNASTNVFFNIAGGISIYSGQILNGAPTGGRLYISNSTGTEDYAADTGSGSTISADKTDCICYIVILSGTSLSNVVYYPMLRLATETDPTFAPYSNICPITGYTECEVDDVGFNQWDEEWELGDYDNSGQATSGDYCIRSKQDDYIPVLGNTVYYAKSPEAIYPCFYDIDKTFISKITVYAYTTFTTPVNARYMRFVVHGSYGTTYNHDICINISKTEGTPKNGDYVPYHSSNATIQFGQTVYGGRSNFTDGGTDDEWNKDDTFSGWYKSSTETSVIIKEITDKKGGANQIYSNTYKYVSNQGFAVPEGAISDSTNSSYTTYVFVNDSRFAGKTIQECQAILESDGMYFVYQVETPTQLSTPPTDLKLLKGTNNITTNGTTINLGYQPDNVIGDVKGEIEKITEMPYLRILDNDVDTEIKNYQLYYRLISSAYTLVNLAEMLQHRFLFVEVIQNPSGTSNHKLLHSALIDPRTIDGFEYQMKAGTGDTVIIESNIAENKFDLSVRYTGTHTSGDPTDYYVTIRMVD